MCGYTNIWLVRICILQVRGSLGSGSFRACRRSAPLFHWISVTDRDSPTFSTGPQKFHSLPMTVSNWSETSISLRATRNHKRQLRLLSPHFSHFMIFIGFLKTFGNLLESLGHSRHHWSHLFVGAAKFWRKCLGSWHVWRTLQDNHFFMYLLRNRVDDFEAYEIRFM